MNQSIEERINKLPSWAKEHIRNLERRTKQAREELHDLLDTKTQTRTYLRSHVLNFGDKAWIHNDEVCFVVDGGEISVRHEDGKLKLMGIGTKGVFSITPNCSNVITVKLTE